MAVSGTYSFSPTNADLLDEAVERIGIDTASITAQHIKSAIRSLNLIFSEWSTKGVKQWTIEQTSRLLTAGDETYNLPSGGIDVLNMVFRKVSGSENRDVPMHRISREEYLGIADKSSQGNPSMYFVDRDRATVTLYLWNVPENSTDYIVYDYIRRIQDAGVFADNPEIPFQWFEAMASALAERMYPKMTLALNGTYDLNRHQFLKAEAATAFTNAMYESRDKTPLRIKVTRK